MKILTGTRTEDKSNDKNIFFSYSNQTSVED